MKQEEKEEEEAEEEEEEEGGVEKANRERVSGSSSTWKPMRRDVVPFRNRATATHSNNNKNEREREREREREHGIVPSNYAFGFIVWNIQSRHWLPEPR